MLVAQLKQQEFFDLEPSLTHIDQLSLAKSEQHVFALWDYFQSGLYKIHDILLAPTHTPVYAICTNSSSYHRTIHVYSHFKE